jgi:hypothetical protein
VPCSIFIAATFIVIVGKIESVSVHHGCRARPLLSPQLTVVPLCAQTQRSGVMVDYPMRHDNGVIALLGCRYQLPILRAAIPARVNVMCRS